MAMQAHVINPAVIQARAANIAAAQAIQVEAVTAVAAPREIVHTAAPTVEAARTYQSIATVTATPVDTTAATAQISGNVAIQAPQGVVVGPRQVTTTGATVGVGGPTALGTGSSVREGIASGRDVVGGKTGERATMHGAYGEGGGRGFGGDGTGSGAGKPCVQRPEVTSYIARVKSRVLSRWNGGENGEVVLEFTIDAAGTAKGIQFVSASNPALGESIAEAMRKASPFEPMSSGVQCLAGETLQATFNLTTN
jgi:TonB family protein